MDAKLAKQMDKEFRRLLQDRLNNIRQHPYRTSTKLRSVKQLKRAKEADFDESPDTSIQKLQLKL